MALEILTYNAAKPLLDLMARNGLLSEAVHIAAKGLSAGWQQETIERLSRTAADELSHRLNLIAQYWEAFRDEESARHPDNPATRRSLRLSSR